MRRWFLLLATLTSAAAFGQFTVVETQNIVYTTGGGFPQLLDLYQPRQLGNMALLPAPPKPAIVFVHGGGWIGGSKADFASWARYYAAKGYVCISINYRLTNIAPWPAQIDDSQAAVRWLRKNSLLLEVDPNRIGAVGASAGGHLVLMLGSRDTLNDVDPNLHGYSSRVQAVADYFGPTDMTVPGEWAPNIWSLIQALAGVPWTPQGPAYQAISPYYYLTPDDAPTLMFHGDADPIVPVAQSRKMALAMRRAGVPIKYIEFPNEGHGFTNGPFITSILALDKYFAMWLSL